FHRLMTGLIIVLFLSLTGFPQSSVSRIESDKLILESDKHLLEGEREKAKKALRKAILADKSYFKPHYKLGVYYYSEKIYKLSVKELSMAREKLQQDQRNNVNSKDLQKVLLFLGESQLQLDRYPEALSVFQDLSLLNPADTGNHERLAWINYKLKQYSESKRLVNDCLKKNPKDNGCLNMSGILYSKEKQFQKALGEYQKARGLDDEVKYNNMGEAYKSLFRYDLAKDSYNRVINSSNNFQYCLSYLNIADIYLSGLNIDQASKVLRQFEQAGYDAMQSRNAPVLTDMGFIYLYNARAAYYSGDLDEAMILLDKATDYPQHFGSIGSTDSHYKHLIYFTKSLVAEGLANYEEEKDESSCWDGMMYKIMSWWYMRKAAEIAVNKLNRLESLYIHTSESAFDYANLSELLKHFDIDMVISRLHALNGQNSNEGSDKRKEAKAFYKLYLAHLFKIKGDLKKAILYLESAIPSFKPDEKALKLKAYSLLLDIYSEAGQKAEENRLSNIIFLIHPPYLRITGRPLPVLVSNMKLSDIKTLDDDEVSDLKDDIMDILSDKRFRLYDKSKLSEEEKFTARKNHVNHEITMRLERNKTGHYLSLELIDIINNKKVATEKKRVDLDNYDKDILQMVNNLSKNTFRYRRE
ncbi:MAG: hypothetical protein OEZ36_03715, partial [Spirochaetota bacterium]|nr:hypothetical protein [Spirochaetota bacterium]